MLAKEQNEDLKRKHSFGNPEHHMGTALLLVRPIWEQQAISVSSFFWCFYLVYEILSPTGKVYSNRLLRKVLLERG